MRHAGDQRPFWLTASTSPRRSASSASARAVSTSSASGFCARTCFPASRARRTSSARAAGCVAMSTISISGSESSSSSAANTRSTPNSSWIPAVASALTSKTPTMRWWCLRYDGRWHDRTMPPHPTMPIPGRRSSGKRGRYSSSWLDTICYRRVANWPRRVNPRTSRNARGGSAAPRRRDPGQIRLSRRRLPCSARRPRTSAGARSTG